MAENTAILSNKKDVIRFSYDGTNIRFKGPYSLKKIVDIKEWDKGYMVVMAEYEGQKEPVEDYIDLIPILQKLYMNPERFLAPIENVKLRDGDDNAHEKNER